MATSSSRISLQLSRFLLIQNAVEDVLGNDNDNFTRHLLNTRLEVLETNWTRFQADHEVICQDATESAEESYLKNRTYERCQEFYVQARAALLVRQDEIEASNASSRISNASAQNLQPITHRGTLPRIEIPKFSGDYNSWRSFHDLFSSMVGQNEQLSNVEKMHYLKTT